IELRHLLFMLAQQGIGQGLGALAEGRKVGLLPGAVGQRMLGLFDTGIGGFLRPVLQVLGPDRCRRRWRHIGCGL
ncbi:hypothetical protein ABTD73_19760, partial [Acinetobacter baumannii]